MVKQYHRQAEYYLTMTLQARDEQKLSQRFGARLLQLRESRDLGLRKAARLIGIDHTRLMSFEKGTERTTGRYTLPTPEIVVKMAQVYQVPKEVLLVEAGYVPWLLDQVASEALVDVAIERLDGR